MANAPGPDIPLDRAALFLDIDGTLLDIAPTPDSVIVPRSLVRTLETLVASTKGAVAFVTGRPLAEADRLFDPLRLAGIGGHGAEFRAPQQTEPERTAPLPEPLRRLLLGFGAIAPGILVEDKGASLAIHYRRAPEAEPILRRALVEQRPALAAANLQVLHGKDIFEVKPRWFNKGTALKRMMRLKPFAGRMPVFFGDDTTDEDAFRVLPEFEGIGISVGRRIKGASHMFDAPEQVRAYLSRIAKRRGS